MSPINSIAGGDSHGAVTAPACATCVDCGVVEAAELLSPMSGRSGGLDFGAGRRFQSRSRSLGLGLSLLGLLSLSLRMSRFRSRLRLRSRPLSSRPLSQTRPRNLSASRGSRRSRGSRGENGPLTLLRGYVSPMAIRFRGPVPYSEAEREWKGGVAAPIRLGSGRQNRGGATRRWQKTDRRWRQRESGQTPMTTCGGRTEGARKAAPDMCE